MSREAVLFQWARVLLTSLADAGVHDVIISPGSRSTPLVSLALREKRFSCHSVLDERSAGFFALGISRAHQRGALLICTSGSALAHYLPALVEAHQSNIPLLVLSADRPEELMGCGAPQTIQQRSIFGIYAKDAPPLGEASEDRDKLRALQRKTHQSVSMSTSPTSGPVHINFPVAKPLAPLAAQTAQEQAQHEWVSQLLKRPPALQFAKLRPSVSSIEALLTRLQQSKNRLLVVCGPASFAEFKLAQKFAHLLGAPFVSEIPFGDNSAPLEFLPAAFDKEPSAQPHAILHVGAPSISATWSRFIQNDDLSLMVLPGESYRDPSQRAQAVLLGDLQALLPELICAQKARGMREHSSFALQFEELRQRISRHVEQVFQQTSHLTKSAEKESTVLDELRVVRTLLENFPPESLILLSNSLSVRLATWCGSAPDASVQLLVTRGANGIDGSIALAAGASAAHHHATYAIMGDVTAAHDLSSLGLLGRNCLTKCSVTIIVLDNEGGRIFDHLPDQDRLVDAPELLDYWRTPPRLDWQAAAQTYGLYYESCKSTDTLARALAEARSRTTNTLLHIKTDSTGTHSLLKTLREPT